jgi:rhodanese-related sulfurtransferase
LSDLQGHLGEFKKEKTYLVYCRSGARSDSACGFLKQHGFKAINLAGGMIAWGGPTASG